MRYKGWTYSTNEDDDGDVRKLWHYATHEDGTVKDLDFSPYARNLKFESFCAIIDLDFPTRSCDMFRSSGPIYEDVILAAYVKHLKHKLETSHDTDRKD